LKLPALVGKSKAREFQSIKDRLFNFVRRLKYFLKKEEKRDHIFAKGYQCNYRIIGWAKV
jgi:hypothetical protein